MKEFICKEELLTSLHEFVKQTCNNRVAPLQVLRLIDKLETYNSPKELSAINEFDGHPVDGFICSNCHFFTKDFSEYIFDEDAQDTYCCEFEIKSCPKCGAKIEQLE